jgi:hypothetical protein
MPDEPKAAGRMLHFWTTSYDPTRTMGVEMNKFVCLSIGTLILLGCATTSSGPIPAGENTWVLNRQEGAFPSGSEPLLAEALAESRAFCSNMAKSFKLVDTYQNAGPYIMGNYPKVTITFSCLVADEIVDESAKE